MDPQPGPWAPQLRRPQGQDPPPDRRLDGTHKVDTRSRMTIRPGMWLDDGIVNTFLRCLCSMQPGRFVTLDSTALESFRLMVSDVPGLPRDQIQEVVKPLRILAATVLGNGGLVFFPFCLNDHWILAVADLQYRIIRIYDSQVQCDQFGTVLQSWNVRKSVLPMVKYILNFCLDANQWTVEPFWLPIKENHTECGVYICLMALQHSYRRGFTHHEYVTSFHDEYGTLSYYQLDECYWLAGRRIIFQICQRFFNPTSRFIRWGEDQLIAVSLCQNLDATPAQQQFHGFNTYRMARSWTLWRVTDALVWASNSIAGLAYPPNLHHNATIHAQARYPDLTLSGEQFRDEIVEEAMKYAWYDPEALVSLKRDIDIAMNKLRREDQNSETRLANRLAQQAWLAQAGTPSVLPSSAEDSDVSTPVVELEVTSPAPSTADLETSPPARPESASTSEVERPEVES